MTRIEALQICSVLWRELKKVLVDNASLYTGTCDTCGAELDSDNLDDCCLDTVNHFLGHYLFDTKGEVLKQLGYNEEMMHNCPCCQYDLDNDGNWCEECPLLKLWDEHEDYETGYVCEETGPYMYVRDYYAYGEGTFNEVLECCDKIADYCDKEIENGLHLSDL